MAGIPGLVGDPRAALAQSLLLQGQQPGRGIGGGLQSAGSSILGALLARQANTEAQKRREGVNQLISQALLGGTAQPAMVPTGAPTGMPQMASAGGGAGFGAAPTNNRQIMMQLLSNPDFINDPRASAVLTMLQPRESKLLSPEEEAQQIRLAQSRRPPQTTVNVGPQGQQFGDPPSGMVWGRNQDGSIMVQQVETPSGITFAPIAVPISGGPVEEERAAAAAEAEQAEAQQQQAEERRQMTAEMLVSDIDRIGQLIQGATLPTTGMTGALLANVGGTNARDIRALLDTIRANIGFEALSQMRQASPTGGALGQITERELQRLEAVMGNLEQSQTEDQFLRNLDRVREEFNVVIHGQRQPPGTSDMMPDPANMPRPTTQEGYDALPEGAWYIDPNGVVARKGQ